jgi:CheY-like chemotaxis protein
MVKTASILVVEDDPAILEGMADLLQLFGDDYQVSVRTAMNGEEGLAAMRRHAPDLIISDIIMPRMNGFEFLAAVRNNPRWVHTPFIFLTAKAKKEDILEGRRRGAELYITKPFSSTELLELVKTQLDRAFELRRIREQRLEALKRNVLQLLNHEFRTPLTYVTAYYEMLAESLRDMSDVATLQEYLRGIRVGASRLAHLVEDLIRIIEMRTGEARTQYQREAQPIDTLGVLLRQRTRLARATAEKRGILVEEQIPDDLPAVFGAPSMIADMIDRLLDNAMKFTQVQTAPEKTVRVSARAEDGEVFLSVADTGIGFPPHIAGLLFDVFYQYNRERLEQQGSGAGLAIVKGFAELHRARIEVESQAGAGSCFTLVFPAYQREQHGPPTGRQQRKPATLLLVEDDIHLLEGLKELLELADGPYALQVITAGDGQEGLAMLERYQPDLIISDIMMPIKSGYEFLREVRANPAWVQIPFIFLTAKGEREDIHRGRRSGVEEYITKPYDIDELIELTVAQLDRYFQRQGALNQSFETLKRGILAMLQPDIKGPLDLVTSYSQRLADGLEHAETDAEMISSLQGIQASSQRLTRLVEDFMAMAEYKTGEAKTSYSLRAEPLRNVGVLVYEAAYERMYGQSELPVQFEFDLQQEVPPVIGDRQRLLGTFRRLLDVIVSLCPVEPPSKIRIASRANPQTVGLLVAASAIRLTPAERKEIAAFLKGDEELLEGPAFGPALTVVKSAIRLHNGHVELKELAGSGLVVRILLPAAPRGGSAEASV